MYARYNIAGIWAGAVGALFSGLPEGIARRAGWDTTTAQRLGFVLYVAAAIVMLLVYRSLRSDRDAQPQSTPVAARRTVLGDSRRTVLELAALFSLDSAGGGFVVTSLLVLWLDLRFDFSAGATGAVFFAAGLLGGFSQFLAPRLAARFGLIRTMAFTHLPANVLLVSTAFAPTGRRRRGHAAARSLFAQMDVPAAASVRDGRRPGRRNAPQRRASRTSRGAWRRPRRRSWPASSWRTRRSAGRS